MTAWYKPPQSSASTSSSTSSKRGRAESKETASRTGSPQVSAGRRRSSQTSSSGRCSPSPSPIRGRQEERSGGEEERRRGDEGSPCSRASSPASSICSEPALQIDMDDDEEMMEVGRKEEPKKDAKVKTTYCGFDNGFQPPIEDSEKQVPAFAISAIPERNRKSSKVIVSYGKHRAVLKRLKGNNRRNKGRRNPLFCYASSLFLITEDTSESEANLITLSQGQAQSLLQALTFALGLKTGSFSVHPDCLPKDADFASFYKAHGLNKKYFAERIKDMASESVLVAKGEVRKYSK